MRLDIMTELEFEEHFLNTPAGTPLGWPAPDWSMHKKTLFTRWVCEKLKSKLEIDKRFKAEVRKNFKKFRRS